MQRLFDLAMNQSVWLAERASQLVNLNGYHDHPMLCRMNWHHFIQRVVPKMRNARSVKEWLMEHCADLCRQHRAMGMQITVVLSLVKIVRQCLDELIDRGRFAADEEDLLHRQIGEGYHRLEEMVYRAWFSPDEDRVAELEQTVQNLVGQRVRYEAIFHRVPDPILVLDMNGCIQTANPAADELLVGPGHSVIGKTIGDAVPWLAGLTSGAAGDQSLIEIEAETVQGQRQLQVKLVWLPALGAGHELETMILLTDVTPLRQQASQLAMRTEELSLLNDYALELADHPIESGICWLVAKRLRQLTGAMFALVSHQWSDLDRWRVYAVDGSSEDLARVEQQLGRSPVGIDFQMDERVAADHSQGKLLMANSLERLALGSLTAEQSQQLEADLGIGDSYSLGLLYKGKAVGTAAFIMAKNQPLDRKSKARILEPFAHLSAMAIQRSMAESRRQRAEAALKEEEDRYRELFETSCDGIAVVDTAGRFLNCNQAYLDLLGYDSIAELKSKTVFEVTPSEYHDLELYVNNEELLKRGFSDEYEKEYYRCDGSRVPVSIRTWVSRGNNGRPNDRWAIVRDISPLKRMEESSSIMEKYRILGELAAAISHEVRNPLTTVRGFLQYFKSKPTYGNEDKEFFDLMIKELDSATGIISDFLDTARPIQLKVQPFDLSATVASLGRVMASRAMLLKVSMVVEADEPLLVRGDNGQIRQVLINLMQNALQAMPSGGALTVRCQRQDNMARVEIADTGIGIAPENMEKIGRPFFTTKPGGSGLGLSTCYRIMNSHRGQIEVESQVGIGTTFVCYLPLSEISDTRHRTVDTRV